MGQSILRSEFTDRDYSDFRAKLADNLDTLEQLLNKQDFGCQPSSIGAEIELALVGADFSPKLNNKEIIEQAHNPRLQVELNRYNLELNCLPHNTTGNGFSVLSDHIAQELAGIEHTCQQMNTQTALIGILPTLQEQHFDASVMTNEPRYHALSSGIKSLRDNEPFTININGQESLRTTCRELTLEGANTSFQFQIRVKPADYVNTFNATQIMTPLAMALGANSPILMNHILWDETRIALFKQSIDTRRKQYPGWRRPNRVSFGYGWLRGSAYEIFAENAALFEPLLPVISTESQQQGEGPPLSELRLHQGSIWHWNRAIYDSADGGHLRIEMRALPSGPTITDMMTNAAFLVGTSYTLSKQLEHILPKFPFMFAEYNFYQAAKKGINSRLLWPLNKGALNQDYPVVDIIESMLPLMEEGLDALGVDNTLIIAYRNEIIDRCKRGQNGATWQKAMVEQNMQHGTREEAIRMMFEEYQLNSKSGEPVANWILK